MIVPVTSAPVESFKAKVMPGRFEDCDARAASNAVTISFANIVDIVSSVEVRAAAEAATACDWAGVRFAAGAD